MDRPISYTGAVPLLNDFLGTNRNVMVALGSALQAILGTATLVDGLACTPTSPASLQVLVGAGSILSLADIDATAYGNLAADTTHVIVKQGILLDAVTLTCTAPTTTGNSINYLVQAAYQDQDTGSTVLPYFNAANPPVAFNGPNNTGTSQNTLRKGACVISLKAGASAPTGTQATPAADAGFTALWVVTVANGATAINSGNIAKANSAPFISEKLGDKVSIPTGDARWMPLGSSFSLADHTALFTASGTWTAPAGVTKIVVDAVAGGGGGAGTNGTTNGGEGGGGGDGIKGQTLTVVPGTTYTITVGAGGTHGAVSANGSAGGASSIGSLLTLTGGGGGNFSGASGGSSAGLGGLSGDANLLFGGAGGGTLFGQGANVRQGLGVAGSGYGSGGSGGSVVASASSVGGDGRSGFVLIQW